MSNPGEGQPSMIPDSSSGVEKGDSHSSVCTDSSSKSLEIRTHTLAEIPSHLPRLEAYVAARVPSPLSYHPGWLVVLNQGLGHTPYCLAAADGDQTRGFLCLAFLNSFLHGRFLVSLPYLNYGGAFTDDAGVAQRLIQRAVQLADELKVRYLELRHEEAVTHSSLIVGPTKKVLMRLPLPATVDELWNRLSAKVRNQVRKGQKAGLNVVWGGRELLREFYSVFSHNMRDLGTPVYSPALFDAMVRQFPGRAELCVIRAGDEPIAGAVLLHGWGITEVPSASSLRRYNPTCANMLLYWHLLERSIQRQQTFFDFGRSSPDSNTFRFKKQWGARPQPTCWQYYQRQGSPADMRPDNPKYRYFIRVWQHLPLSLTRWLGPWVVRGIP